jgi:hypothetical protein
MSLPPGAREAILGNADRLLAMELPDGLAAGQREAVRGALQNAFVVGYRWGMLVNLVAAASGVVVGVATIPRRPESARQNE